MRVTNQWVGGRCIVVEPYCFWCEAAYIDRGKHLVGIKESQMHACMQWDQLEFSTLFKVIHNHVLSLYRRSVYDLNDERMMTFFFFPRISFLIKFLSTQNIWPIAHHMRSVDQVCLVHMFSLSNSLNLSIRST